MASEMKCSVQPAATHCKSTVQIQGFLPTLLHHKLYPQENVPKVQLISMKGARQLTGSYVLRDFM